MRIDETDLFDMDIIESHGWMGDAAKFVDMGSSINVCRPCHQNYGFSSDVSHPSYESDYTKTYCFICDKLLSAEDDGEV